MVLGQRANSQGWIFMVELPSGMVNGAQGTVQLMKGIMVVRDILED